MALDNDFFLGKFSEDFGSLLQGLSSLGAELAGAGNKCAAGKINRNCSRLVDAEKFSGTGGTAAVSVVNFQLVLIDLTAFNRLFFI